MEPSAGIIKMFPDGRKADHPLLVDVLRPDDRIGRHRRNHLLSCQKGEDLASNWNSAENCYFMDAPYPTESRLNRLCVVAAPLSRCDS